MPEAGRPLKKSGSYPIIAIIPLVLTGCQNENVATSLVNSIVIAFVGPGASEKL